MTFDLFCKRLVNYQEFVDRCLETPSRDRRYLGANLSAECGETIGVMAKDQRKDYDMRTYCDKLSDELGDVLFMLYAIAQELNITEGVIDIVQYEPMFLDTLECKAHFYLLEIAHYGLRVRDRQFLENNESNKILLNNGWQIATRQFFLVLAMYQASGYSRVNLNNIIRLNREKLGDRHGYK